MLDLLTLEEAQAAIDTVRQPGIDQGMLQRPRLGIGTVQDRHIGKIQPFASQGARFANDELGLVTIRPPLVKADRLAVAGIGPQVLAQTAVIAFDQRVGRLEDRSHGPVVLFQPDRLRHGKVCQQGTHIADFRTTERVNGLVVVADGKQIAMGTGQQLQPSILQAVGILKLVDENVPETLAIVLAQCGIGLEHLVTAQQQLGKIAHPFTAALRIVGGIDLDHLAGIGIVGTQLAGPYPGLLVAVDKARNGTRRKLFIGQLEAFQQAFDHSLLVLGIENLEGRRQAGVTVMDAQKAVAQAMEGADPHGTHIDRNQRGQAGLHLARRLVGEGHGQNTRRAGLGGGQQPGNTGGQHAGLAAAGTRQHQRGACRPGHGTQLFGIQTVEQISTHNGARFRQNPDSTSGRAGAVPLLPA